MDWAHSTGRKPGRWAAAGAVVVLAALTHRPAAAGIVNVQSILATEADQGPSGSITGGADWRAGNSERLTLSLAPVARYRRGRHLAIGVVRGELFRDKDGAFDRKTFEHARYRYLFSERALGEVFAQHEYNELRRLSLRALFGVGPQFDVVDSGPVRMGVGIAYMLEYERLQDTWKLDEDADDGDGDVLSHRISSYLTGSYELKEDRLQAIQTLYAQPAITDPGDVRLLSESQLVIKLSEHLALTTSFVFALDARPPVQDSTVPAESREVEVEAYDTTLKSSLTYSF